MSRVRPTNNQMKCLVDLMAHDPQLCSSKFTQSFTHKIAQQRWESIAVQLNSLPGAEKDWHKWKKTWQDTRNITKSKAAAIKRHLGGTGGGPSCLIELNEIQLETLPLLSQAVISGHSESLESIVEFVFDGTTDDVNKQINIGAEGLCAEELVESFICNDSENENPPLIDEEADKSSNTYTYLKQDIVAVNENSDKPSTSKPSTKIRAQPKLKRKITVASKLGESNSAANRLANIAEKKCDMKAAYYEKKLKLMEEKNVSLRNLETLFVGFINGKLHTNLETTKDW